MATSPWCRKRASGLGSVEVHLALWLLGKNTEDAVPHFFQLKLDDTDTVILFTGLLS